MIRILSGEDVRKALPMRQAVEAIQKAFAQLSTGEADAPLRTGLPVPKHNGITLIMPGYLAGDDQLAVKIVSVFNDNPAKGLPLIHAVVVVVDAETGAPAAIVDGTYLTALRTGAASGAATNLLARQDSYRVAIFGAGVQARRWSHLLPRRPTARPRSGPPGNSPRSSTSWIGGSARNR